MFAEVLNLNVFNLLLVFARVGSLLMVLPGIGDAFVPVRPRLLLALAFSLVSLPVVAGQLPAIPATAAGLVLLLAGEIVIGIMLGLVARIMVTALQAAGTVIAFVSSMANAFVFDPIAEQQGSLVSGMFVTMGVVLLFVTDMHHLLLRGAIGSYVAFPPGDLPPAGDMSQLITRTVADAFRLGVQLAAPFLLLSFAFNVALGLLARLSPQFPVFFVGLPLQMMLAFTVMAMTISGIMMVFLRWYDGRIGDIFPF